MDRAEPDDEIPDEDADGTEEDEEEKRRGGARRRTAGLFALPKLLAALLGGLSVKRRLSSRSFVALMIIAALMVAADAALAIFSPEYAAVRAHVLALAVSLIAAGGLTALLVSLGRKKAAATAQEPEYAEPPEEEPQPMTFIDAGGEFTIDPKRLCGTDGE
jgi:hypothetical protein